MEGAQPIGVMALGRDEPAGGFHTRFGLSQDQGWKPGSLAGMMRGTKGAGSSGARPAAAAAPAADNANDIPHDSPAVDPVDQARADAFALGFDEGMRVATESMVADDAAISHLAESLALLAPAATGALPALLSAAVLRLVEQVVGKAQVDVDLLTRRVEAVAAFIEEEQARKSLHLHPDDIALLAGHELGVELTPDTGMTRGSVRLDSGEGWIEDGPDVQLSRLKAMLDTMEDGAI